MSQVIVTLSWSLTPTKRRRDRFRSSIMSPNISYYELGFQTKHVKLAVKIPDLRSSKIQLKKSLKKPKTMMRNRRRRREQVDTTSLSSINIDWNREFEEKYAELLVKTYRKKMEDKVVKMEKYQEDVQSVSMIPQTSLLMGDTSINLSLNNNKEDQEEKEKMDDTLADHQEQRNLLTAKKLPSRKNLEYSYHVLKRRVSIRK